MLEKAKNRKIFYFFILVILGVNLCLSPASAVTWLNATSQCNGQAFKYYASGSTWSNIHDASTASTSNCLSGSSVGGMIYVTDSTPNEYVYLGRLGICYDTSSIPDDAIIGNCSLDLWIQDSQTSYSPVPNVDIDLVTYTPPSCSITTAEYDNFGTTVIDSVSYAEIDTYEGSYYSFNVPSMYINKLGNTYFGFRLSPDTDNTPIPFVAGKNIIVYTYSTKENYLRIPYGDEYEKEAKISVDVSSGETPLDVTITDESTGFSESYPYPTYTIYYGDGDYLEGERQYTGENWFHEYNTELASKNFTIIYTINDGGILYTDTQTITVTSNTDNFYIQVVGLNTSAISGANVSIWYNGAYQDSEGTSAFGKAYFTIPDNRLVTGTVTKPGYKNATFSQYVGTTDTWKVVTLYLEEEEEGSGDSYGNYIVTFKDINTGLGVDFSNIEVYSDSGYTTLFYDEYSNSDGIWTGLLPMNVTYYYKYPETIGYYGQTWSYNLTSSQAYKTVNLIPKSGATATITSTPTVTVTTITPIVTYTYNDGNLSTLNVKERFTNLLVLAGFQNAESADLIFAMIIVLGCTALIGWITLSGSGAGMGAIIGFVFSLGLGLIPLWLLIAAIFFGCLYVALKLFGGSGE